MGYVIDLFLGVFVLLCPVFWWGDLHRFFHNDSTDVHSHQQCINILSSTSLPTF